MNIESESRRIREQFSHLFPSSIHRMRFGNRRQNLPGLVQLINSIPFKGNGIEVGSFAGESALILMECGVENLTCIDLWASHDDGVYAFQESSIGIAERTFDVVASKYPTITKRKGRSSGILQEFQPGQFDFIYIDGDHSYEGCSSDIRLALPLIRKGGAICGHDYKRTIHPGVTQAIHETIGKPDAVFQDSSWMKTLR